MYIILSSCEKPIFRASLFKLCKWLKQFFTNAKVIFFFLAIFIYFGPLKFVVLYMQKINRSLVTQHLLALNTTIIYIYALHILHNYKAVFYKI